MDRIQVTMQQFGNEIHLIRANAKPGSQVVLCSAGEIKIQKKGFLNMREEQVIVGAIVEVYQTQPEYSDKAFENMKEIIRKKDLTLEEIEALPIFQ